MKNYKLFLTGLLIVGLSACGGGGKKNSASTPSGDDKNLVSSEDAGSPSVDDKSQSSSKIAPIAILGGSGLGAVLALMSAANTDKLATLFKNRLEIQTRLRDLAKAKRAYNAMKATLTNDVNGSMTPGLKVKFEALNAEMTRARATLVEAELKLAHTQAQLKYNPAERIAKIDANVTHNSADFPKLIAYQSSRKEALEALPKNEKALADAKAALASIEGKMSFLFTENRLLYPVYKNYQMARLGLRRIVLTLDINFSKLFAKDLAALVRGHTGKLKWSTPNGADDVSKVVGSQWSTARVTYLTAAGGFVIVAAGYTLWTTLSDAESDGNNLALDVKEVFKGDELTMEEAVEQSKADVEDAS